MSFEITWETYLNSSTPGQNGCHVHRRRFQMHFLERKWQNSALNFTEMCSQESNWQLANISSGNGLSPTRRQAITWTNANPVYWRIYAALGGDELNRNSTEYSHLNLRYIGDTNKMTGFQMVIFILPISYKNRNINKENLGVIWFLLLKTFLVWCECCWLWRVCFI